MSFSGVPGKRNPENRIFNTIAGNQEAIVNKTKAFENDSSFNAGSGYAGGPPAVSSGNDGNFLPTAGGTMIGPIAFFPKIGRIKDGVLDISAEAAFSSRVIVVSETIDPDVLNFIKGAVHAGQLLILQGVIHNTITVTHDPSGNGSDGKNIRTLNGNPIALQSDNNVMLIFDSIANQWEVITDDSNVSNSVGFPYQFTKYEELDNSQIINLAPPMGKYHFVQAIGDLTFAFEGLPVNFAIDFIIDVRIDETIESITWPSNLHNVPTDLPLVAGSRFVLAIAGINDGVTERFVVSNAESSQPGASISFNSLGIGANIIASFANNIVSTKSIFSDSRVGTGIVITSNATEIGIGLDLGIKNLSEMKDVASSLTPLSDTILARVNGVWTPGFITNANVSANADIEQSKIQNLELDLGKKLEGFVKFGAGAGIIHQIQGSAVYYKSFLAKAGGAIRIVEGTNELSFSVSELMDSHIAENAAISISKLATPPTEIGHVIVNGGAVGAYFGTLPNIIGTLNLERQFPKLALMDSHIAENAAISISKIAVDGNVNFNNYRIRALSAIDFDDVGELASITGLRKIKFFHGADAITSHETGLRFNVARAAYQFFVNDNIAVTINGFNVDVAGNDIINVATIKFATPALTRSISRREMGYTTDGMYFNLNNPIHEYNWFNQAVNLMQLTNSGSGGLLSVNAMRTTLLQLEKFNLSTHSDGFMSRFENDVIVGTGGKTINLSKLGDIGFPIRYPTTDSYKAVGGDTQIIDLDDEQSQLIRYILTDDIALEFENAPRSKGQPIMLVLRQDQSGEHTVSFPATFLSVPKISLTSNTETIVMIMAINTLFYAFVVGDRVTRAATAVNLRNISSNIEWVFDKQYNIGTENKRTRKIFARDIDLEEQIILGANPTDEKHAVTLAHYNANTPTTLSALIDVSSTVPITGDVLLYTDGIFDPAQIKNINIAQDAAISHEKLVNDIPVNKLQASTNNFILTSVNGIAIWRSPAEQTFRLSRLTSDLDVNNNRITDVNYLGFHELQSPPQAGNIVYSDGLSLFFRNSVGVTRDILSAASGFDITNIANGSIPSNKIILLDAEDSSENLLQSSRRNIAETSLTVDYVTRTLLDLVSKTDTLENNESRPPSAPARLRLPSLRFDTSKSNLGSTLDQQFGPSIGNLGIVRDSRSGQIRLYVRGRFQWYFLRLDETFVYRKTEPTGEQENGIGKYFIALVLDTAVRFRLTAFELNNFTTVGALELVNDIPAGTTLVKLNPSYALNNYLFMLLPRINSSINQWYRNNNGSENQRNFTKHSQLLAEVVNDGTSQIIRAFPTGNSTGGSQDIYDELDGMFGRDDGCIGVDLTSLRLYAKMDGKWIGTAMQSAF